MNSEHEKYGERFLAVRSKLKLTVDGVAEKLGITASYVSAIANGRKHPSEALKKLISVQLGASRLYLDEGEGEMFSVSPEALAVIDARGEKLKDELGSSLASLGRPPITEEEQNLINDYREADPAIQKGVKKMLKDSAIESRTEDGGGLNSADRNSA